jgi:hypothetical protein
MPEGRRAGAGSDQQHVGVAVIAAVGLDDLRAAGEAAGEAQRAHRRLGARRDQADHAAAQPGTTRHSSSANSTSPARTRRS